MLDNFKKPGYGYYWIIGGADAMNGHPRQVLSGTETDYWGIVFDLTQYQDSYDGGYDEGLWNIMYTQQEWM